MLISLGIKIIKESRARLFQEFSFLHRIHTQH